MLLPLAVPAAVQVVADAYAVELLPRVLKSATLVLAVLYLLGPLAPPLRNLFVLPPGYTGWVEIAYENPACPPAPIQGRYRRFLVTPTGSLCTYLPGVDLIWQGAGLPLRGEYYDRWVYANALDRPLRTTGPARQVSGIGTNRTERTVMGQTLFGPAKINFFITGEH